MDGILSIASSTLGSTGVLLDPAGGTGLESFTIIHLFPYGIRWMDYSIARKRAFQLLSMRNYHSVVLARKLELKGCSPEDCQRVIEECKRLGFLKDDEAILQEFRRGYGPRYIEWKLGVEVRSVITREMQREKIQEFKRKGILGLQRRGFDLDLILEQLHRRG